MVVFKLFLYFCIYADGGRQIECVPITMPYEFASEKTCKRAATAFAYSEAIKLRRRFKNMGNMRWVYRCRAETSVKQDTRKPRLPNRYE